MNIAYQGLMKAFDTVPHERLLHKISRYEIKDPLYGWIRSVLSSRSQYVTINCCKSMLVPVASGIHQGSIISPLVFVIYI